MHEHSKPELQKILKGILDMEGEQHWTMYHSQSLEA